MVRTEIRYSAGAVASMRRAVVGVPLHGGARHRTVYAGPRRGDTHPGAAQADRGPQRSRPAEA